MMENIMKICIVLLFSGVSFAEKMRIVSVTPETRLIIQRGDITQCKVDAIVNAANEQLSGGGGVCGAIFDAAGWDDLQKACNQHPARNTIRCPAGEACITPSCKLKDRGIRWIIHAVGPDCRIIKEKQQQDGLLAQAYEKSLKLVDAQGDIRSLAFPFISSAIYAFPKERAAKIALRVVVDYLRAHQTKVHEIHFVLFSQEDYELFCGMAQQLGLKRDSSE
jgi:O-acetyl-ADP-ribose deacetylase (regulator of RNase III)